MHKHEALLSTVFCFFLARLSFLHRSRDQVRPGRHNLRFFDICVSIMRF